MSSTSLSLTHTHTHILVLSLSLSLFKRTFDFASQTGSSAYACKFCSSSLDANSEQAQFVCMRRFDISDEETKSLNAARELPLGGG
jgi:hypothetical protein